MVDVRATAQAAATSVRRLPRVALLVALLAELGIVAGTRVIVAPLGLLLSELLSVFLGLYLITILIGAEPNSRVELGRAIVRRVPAVIGVALVQLLVLVLSFIGVYLVFGAVVAPQVFTPGATPAPMSATQAALVLVCVEILAAPFHGRWFCALPLIVIRHNGPKAALRASWAATRGATLRCAGIWFALVFPGLVSTLLPAAVRLPWIYAAGLTDALLLAAFAVTIYRQLCPDLQHDYPIDEAGRAEFEADAAILARQGYVVAASVDAGGVRSIAFGRPESARATPGQRLVTAVAGTLLLVILVGVVALSLSAPSGTSSAAHPLDSYSAGCNGCTMPAFDLSRYQAAADLLRPALAAAGPPTRVNPSALRTQTGVDPAAEEFQWTPASGWYTLHGVPTGSTITKVIVLLGGYYQDRSTDVLVELDGRTDSALDYKIDGPTMQRIANGLSIPALPQ